LNWLVGASENSFNNRTPARPQKTQKRKEKTKQKKGGGEINF
jgi:hypothetical protein